MEQINIEDGGLLERYALAMDRIRQICTEETVKGEFGRYFRETARFLIYMEELYSAVKQGSMENWTLEQCREQNEALYRDILPENYESSYANPAYAVRTLGEVFGRILSFLYTELRGLIVYAYEQRLEEALVHLELFIEIYNAFEQETLPEYREIQQMVYWFVSDYTELFAAHRVREAVDPTLDFAVRIVMDSDLSDLRYLYRYGEYVSENELETARFLNSLSEEEIASMADTYTEGYRIGFIVDGKDLSIKKTVNIRYQLGFERMIRKAIRNFEAMGLKPVIYRSAVSTVNKKQHLRIGYGGAVPNKQFDYDHKGDAALYLDKKFMERKLGVMRTAYEQYKELANVHAGPAVVEVFGEVPFAPVTKPEAYRLSEKEQQHSVQLANETAQLTNQYIIGEERSFTIIAFPVPEIGADYEAVFHETIRINTLDSQLYQRIQQTIIDALDQGVGVHIRGCGANRTDLTVAFAPLAKPAEQTLFTNCVADVNIPVGEVFTTPQLFGTNGILHVTQVYLGELNYRDLALTFQDGMITDYSCGNFADEEENRAYVRENVLFHHDSLPLGEFAIGTNTTAYAMAQRYRIADRLPILIVEKMGPHFAVGDTCFSWQEDVAVYNPDRKEIIARDNEVSVLRREDPSKAYLGCHTDITIPYEELGSLEVLLPDGSRTAIIRDSRFVLPGTEELNGPLSKI